MKNKLKYGLTLTVLAFLVGCSDKGSIQRPNIGSGSTAQDSSSTINSESANSNTSDTKNDSTSEIDPVELSNYQYYPLPDKTWAIAVGNNKYLEKLTLPEQYQGRKVTQIAENGFKDCGALREISIPSSVLTIGAGAFSKCSSLTGIVIPDGVTSIGNSAFEGCTSLTEIVIPEGVTSIGRYTFSGCSSLTICCQAQSEPSGWDKDWNPTYRLVVWGCIRVGDQDCFEYAVISIEGVESATIIGYTGSDASIAVPETIGGIKVTTIADSAFEGRSSLTGIVIPDGVTTIGAYAFRGCSSLTGIVIPEGVTTIGAYAFDGCTSLTGIVIPEGVTNIGDYAFFGCSSLTGIVIPDGVTSIGYSAFSGCSSLTGIVIPEGVTTIRREAFYGCSRLTICCQAQSRPSGWDYGWNGSGCPVIWGCSGIGTSGSLNYRIDYKNGEESITITGYTGADSEAVIPETIGGVKVTAIADSAFDGCTSLAEIVIPEGVTSIGKSAFEGCSSLKGIVIPNGVTAIADSAFEGCTSLTSIVIPNSVTDIGYRAFYDCSRLTICCQAQSKPSGWDKGWNPSYCLVVWGCTRAGNQDGFEYAVTSIEGVESATITGYTGSDVSIAVPETIGGAKVTAIADSAFEGCSSLKGIAIPEGVTTIGAYAFDGCTSLAEIVIPEGVTDIGYSAFRDCASLTSIVIPNGVTSIGACAFWGCTSLTSIAIPNSVTNIGDSAFEGCTSLTSIAIPNSVRGIGEYTFERCTSLTSIVIPDGVRGIGEYAFDGCTSLTSIVIPNSVTFIGRYAFDGCSRLTICCKARSKPSGWHEDWNPSSRPVVWGCIRAGNQDCFEYAVTSIEGVESATITGYTGSDVSIAVPETIGGAKVTAIADSAFEGCSSLTGIAIPEGVTAIGDRAFYGCSSLTSIVIPNSVTSIGAYAFYGCSSLTICCQAQSKPSGWSDSWNPLYRPVVWGYSGNGTSGSLN